MFGNENRGLHPHSECQGVTGAGIYLELHPLALDHQHGEIDPLDEVGDLNAGQFCTEQL